MKTDIHPSYHQMASVTCSCGNTFLAGSTKESLRVELCSKCHPFFTGEQKIVDTEGRVERLNPPIQAERSQVIDPDRLSRCPTAVR